MPRRLFHTLVAATMLAGLAAISAGPTGATVSAPTVCSPDQTVFGVHTNGTLYHYPFYDLSSTATPVHGPRTQAGTGWQMYGHVFGGANGNIYGLKAEGLYEYAWKGQGFAGPARKITTTFSGFVSGANRNKLTADASGAFYAITGTGMNTLYRYIVDPVQGKIVNTQLMQGGWGDYTMIIGAGNGIIYSRNAAGELFRTRFDPGSHRLLSPTRRVGTGWNIFTTIVSAGADILMGVKSTGELIHYVYDEQSWTWPIMGRQIGTNWQQYTDLPVVVDSCKHTTSDAPAPVSVNAEPGAPIAVMPSSDGTRIDYSYVDSFTGRPWWGHQREANDFGSIVWPSTPLDADTYVGVPAMVEHAPKQVGIVAQRNDGHFVSTAQTAADSETLRPWRPEGGVMPANSNASSVMTRFIPVDKPFVSLSAVDTTGNLWRSVRSGTDFLTAWERVWEGAGLVGTPKTVQWRNSGSWLTVSRTAAGGFAGWHEGVGDFPYPPKYMDIGLSDSTGRFALTGNGGAALLYVRDSAGAIQRKSVYFNPRDGELQISAWQKHGGDGVTFAGAPSATLLPDGRSVVTARGTDGKIYASVSSGPWEPVSALTYTGDPTVFPYTKDGVATWAVVTYNQDYQVNAFTPVTTTAAKSTSTVFERHVLKH